MKCFVRVVNGNMHASFDWSGVSYTHSLRTKDEREAEVRIGPIRDTLYRLEQGTLQIPPGAEPKAFILSGGRQTQKATPSTSLTLKKLAELFLSTRKVEPNTLKTLTFHFNHLRRIIGEDRALDSIRLTDIQKYADARTRERHHGKPIRPYTVRKEILSLRQGWNWAVEFGHVEAAPTWRYKTLDMDKDQGREPFRTYDQISQRIARGGLSAEKQAALWETLYLTSDDLNGMLDHVRDNASQPFVYPMVAFVALTGCRRSEMIRSLVDDWDLSGGKVVIREKKRDKKVTFTTREVDIHPRLSGVMKAWFDAHPGGQHAIARENGPLTIDQATDHFKRAMEKDEKWSKLRGFHTLRHSVASILASKGVDQRYIDRIIGHQTEAMRKRYQHLFPKGVRQAIELLV